MNRWFARLFLLLVIGNPVVASSDDCPHVMGSTQEYGGLAVAATTELAVIADGSDGLHVLDISDPSDPEWLGTYNDTNFNPKEVVVSGSLAYVSTGWSLSIVDISDPTDPVRISSVNIVNGLDLDVQGAYLYVADTYDGLHVFDVADPLHPAHVGFLPTDRWPACVLASGDIAYVGESYGFRTVDISDPTQPTTIGFLALSTNPSDIEFDDGVVFLSQGYGDVLIIDVGDPTAPSIIHQIAPEIRVWDLAYDRGLLYLGDGDLLVLDVRVPSDPVEVGRHDYYEGYVAVAGEYVVLTRYSPQVQILQGCNAGIFADDFESGDTIMWTGATP